VEPVFFIVANWHNVTKELENMNRSYYAYLHLNRRNENIKLR